MKSDLDKILETTDTTIISDSLRDFKKNCNLQYENIFNIIVDIKKYGFDDRLKSLDKIQSYYELDDIRSVAIEFILKRDKESFFIERIHDFYNKDISKYVTEPLNTCDYILLHNDEKDNIHNNHAKPNQLYIMLDTKDYLLCYEQ